MEREPLRTADSLEQVIRFSRTKLAGFGFGSLAFVALGLFLWTIADDVDRESPLFVKLVSAACVAFFGMVSLSSLPKLLDPRPGVVINDRGILDNSSGVSSGWIEWADILKTDVRSAHGHSFLLIHVIDPRKYVSRAGLLKRILMRLNERWHGTPLCISTKALECNFEALESLVVSNIAARKGYKGKDTH